MSSKNGDPIIIADQMNLEWTYKTGQPTTTALRRQQGVTPPPPLSPPLDSAAFVVTNDDPDAKSSGIAIAGKSSSNNFWIGRPEFRGRAAVQGESNDGVGVGGESGTAVGVHGHTDAEDNSPRGAAGVLGTSYKAPGVAGVLGIANWAGVWGVSEALHGAGVLGQSWDGDSIVGLKDEDSGVAGLFINVTTNRDRRGKPTGLTLNSAADFVGHVSIYGDLNHSGGVINSPSKNFKIDHPLDPANSFLYHAGVESPDMKNIYDGVVKLDRRGSAVVRLPKWFGALNKDFRYQLTPIGAPAPNLHIAETVSHNQFKIAGGSPGMQVSWQVTGIRQDAWANAHRTPVEQRKPRTERGRYLHPEVHEKVKSRALESTLSPALLRRLKQAREIEKISVRPAKRRQ